MISEKYDLFPPSTALVIAVLGGNKSLAVFGLPVRTLFLIRKIWNQLITQHHEVASNIKSVFFGIDPSVALTSLIFSGLF